MRFRPTPLPAVLAAALAAALALGAAGYAAAHTAGVDMALPGPGLGIHGFILYAHVLLFVLWLGADLGVFLSARAVAAPGRTPADRLNAAWLMAAIDVAPRIAASLMLTVGGLLTEFVGLPHPAWQMAGILMLGPVWLGLVLVAWFRRDTGLGAAVDRAETWLRALLIPGVLLSVAWSWSSGRLDEAPYVAGKLVVFAALLALGLWMRLRFRPFRQALALLASAGNLDGAHEAAMVRSLRRTEPLVLASWVLLMLAAWLGVSRAGAPLPGAAIPVQAAAAPAPQSPPAPSAHAQQ